MKKKLVVAAVLIMILLSGCATSQGGKQTDMINSPESALEDERNASGLIRFEYIVYDEMNQTSNKYIVDAIADDNIQLEVEGSDVEVTAKKLEANSVEQLLNLIDEFEIEQWLTPATDEPIKYEIILSYRDGSIYSVGEPLFYHTREHETLNTFFEKILSEN